MSSSLSKGRALLTPDPSHSVILCVSAQKNKGSIQRNKKVMYLLVLTLWLLEKCHGTKSFNEYQPFSVWYLFRMNKKQLVRIVIEVQLITKHWGVFQNSVHHCKVLDFNNVNCNVQNQIISEIWLYYHLRTGGYICSLLCQFTPGGGGVPQSLVPGPFPASGLMSFLGGGGGNPSPVTSPCHGSTTSITQDPPPAVTCP